MIDASTLNQHVTLLKPSIIDGPAGETTTTYVPICEVWASVRTETGRELLRNNRVEAELTYAIRIRYRFDVREGWRIDYHGKTLDISKLIPIGDRYYDALDILATEVR